MSQEDLATAAHLDRTYISGVERGQRNLGLLNILAIAKALNVHPSDLFPQSRTEGVSHPYILNQGFSYMSGFTVTAIDVYNSVVRTNRVLDALPNSLFRTVDFKSQSGMVGAIFVSELASEVEAIPNPIEKGHPDIVPLEATTASERELRNYPLGLEIKSTVGNVTRGAKRAPGVERIGSLEGLTWQAHHRNVTQLMGLTWDYVGGSTSLPRPPVITGVFFADDLVQDDWGSIAGTTGRNTKVTGMKVSGKYKMSSGAVVLLNDSRYLEAFNVRLGKIPNLTEA